MRIDSAYINAAWYLTIYRDEHYSRSANCPFFSLITSKPAPSNSRSKTARSSKASRLSLQSIGTAVSDMTSVADMTADIDDSVLTTASNMTTASKASKRTTKSKKATTSRAKKTRAKKNEAVEVHEVEVEQEENVSAPPPSKPVKGRKRSSDEMEDSVLTVAEAPAPKKRATKTRKAQGSNATEVSQADTEMLDAPEPTKKAASKKTARKASGTRKASARSTRKASLATTRSTASPPPRIPDDDEIDRQLQADLERTLDNEEEGVIADADPETKRAAASLKDQNAQQVASQEDLLAHTATTDFAMFDPAPAEPTDEQIEADLQSMRDEMGVEPKEPEPEEIKVSKKGHKAGTRKASKQTTTKKAKKVAAPVEQPQSRMPAEAEEPDEIAEADVSFASTGTVVRKSLSRTSLSSINSTTTAKPKRGRPPKKKVSQDPIEVSAEAAAGSGPAVEPAPEIPKADDEPNPVPVEVTKKGANAGKRGRPKKMQAPVTSSEETRMIVKTPAEPEPEAVQLQTETQKASIQETFSNAGGSPRIARKPVPIPKDSPVATQRKNIPSAPVPASQLLAHPKTPRHHTSPVQSAKQATVSPSPSPQTSDAENQPPSSKPGTTSSKAKRMPLGELPVATPTRQMSVSPSKQQQNVIGGLQSSEQWTAVDLDTIFEEYYHNQDSMGSADPTGRFFAKGGELTDQERNMTVEEWIYHNAGQAEQKLKFECESMVMQFESQGTRAMRVLEGLVAE